MRKRELIALGAVGVLPAMVVPGSSAGAAAPGGSGTGPAVETAPFGNGVTPPNFPIEPAPNPGGTVTHTINGNSETFTATGELGSELDVSFPTAELTPASVHAIDSELASLASTNPAASVVRPHSDYGYGDTIGCAETGHYYSWSDGNGTLSLTQQCTKAVVNWGFQISPQLGSMIISPVQEMGMAWYKNSQPQPNNAPHTEPWDYLFHGTFNPVGDNGVVLNYGDIFDFTIDIDGIAGAADLVINGKVTTENF